MEIGISTAILSNYKVYLIISLHEGLPSKINKRRTQYL